MQFITKETSKIDKVVKYVFKVDFNSIAEFSYIDNNTGKDIICVSCQTMCNMGCKFCHCTDYIGKVRVRTLTGSEIFDGIEHIVKDLGITCRDTILISYMGCGEPFNT